MKKAIYLSVLSFLLMASASYAQLSKTYTDRLDQVFDSVCKKYKMKGASAAVIVPGGGTWLRTYGESYAGNPITSDMIFSINSNTKTYMSALMLLLQEKGMVSINDTIGKWLTPHKNINGQITIRQLMNHTSGIFSFTENDNFWDSINMSFTRFWKPEEVLGFVNAPYFKPGKDFHYSNTNYTLVAMIIEKVTGQPLNAVLRKYILEPQGLDHTFFTPYDTTSATIPHIWSRYARGSSLLDVVSVFDYKYTAMNSISFGAGNIMATAEDNAKFWNALLSGKILSDSSMHLMRTYVPLDNYVGYGLGIFRYNKVMNNRTVFCHGGTNFGFINENLVDSASGITISILTNQDSINNDMLIDYIELPLHKASFSTPYSGVEEQSEMASGIRIYPNPASDVLHVDLTSIKPNTQLQVIDMMGRERMKLTINAEQNTLPLEGLSSGQYILRVLPTDKSTPYSVHFLLVR